MEMFFCHSANLVNDSCKGGPLGPSGAHSYAVGVVPQTLQLRGKNWGSHPKFAGSHPRFAGSHPSIAGALDSIVAVHDVDASWGGKSRVAGHAWRFGR